MSRRIGLLLLLLALLLVGCQEVGTSKEPTDYIVMGVGGGSRLQISGYLTEEHPAVESAQKLADEFLHVYLNQDYQNLTLEAGVRPLWKTSTIGDDGLAWHIRELEDNEIAVSLVELSQGSIIFTPTTDGRINSAVLQAEAVLHYTHAKDVWLRSRGAALNADYRAAFDLRLLKDEKLDQWKVQGITQTRAGD